MSDHESTNPYQDLPPINDDVGTATHFFLILCLTVLVAFGYWAWQGTLDIVSVAEGEVVPSSQVKSIQHLEGGIVREIKVKEGQTVTEDQPLIVLESTASGADLSELTKRIAGLEVEIVRLEAESTGAKEPAFSESQRRSHPALVREATQTFHSRINLLSDKLAGADAVISQRRQDIKEISARIRNGQKSLKLLKEQISISDQLLRDNLSNRYKHLDLLKEAARLEGQIDEGKVALERAKSALNQAEAGKAAGESEFKQEVHTALDLARRQLEEFKPRLAKYEDSLERTVLRSPVKGVVKTVHVTTIGGVLKPGDSVVDIVPAGDRLVIEAKLLTQDIGFVRSGQDAVVKLASADAMRFDNLDGKVVSVSPDTLLSPEGQPFYKVRIETRRDHFRRGANRYDLFPGMQVSTSIHTGQRTVLEYLIDPFLDARDRALQER